MAGNRFRGLDYWHFRYITQDNDTMRAADEIINTPDKHLLTQSEVFWAEGGPVGLAVQLGVVGAGLAGLFSVRPKLLTYLKNAQLRPLEWLTIGAVAYVGHDIGVQAGATIAGDRQKLRNHWMAYYFVKANNRMEGRQILTKPPKFY